MEETLVKKSDILKIKYKFFIYRILIYFSFLLIPIWIQKTQSLNLFIQSIILLMYMSFMGSQWYLLGKELDHRLKIYYRANSSVDRLVYRIIVGSIIMMLLFNIISLAPSVVATYIFWTLFVVLGFFYSWPTRGKIIQESVSDQFSEFRYLDSFEKTVLFLSIFTFFISLPELPMFENIEALKLYFDPQEKVSVVLWNYLSILYLPFKSFPKLYNLIWSFHFYFFGVGTFLFSLYCILRYFFSRRLSLLGIFSVISTWSFSRILNMDYFYSLSSTISLIWLWSYMWSTKSSTYRSGLLTGLVSAYATAINPLAIFLFVFSTLGMSKFFLKDKTQWYIKQWLKYNILGFVIALSIFAQNVDSVTISYLNFDIFLEQLGDHLYRKAFFVISPIGFILALLFYSKKSSNFLTIINFDRSKFIEVFYGLLGIFLVGLLLDKSFFEGLSLIWIIAIFSLIPIEWVFQSISRLRSKRNLIYALYILVCILDSHLENRIRIVAKMFLDSESFKFFIQL